MGRVSAPAVLNLVHLPMAFGSDLWIPLAQVPEVVQAIAPFMPPYHLAQLALGTFGAADGGSPLLHLAALAAFTRRFPGRRQMGLSTRRGTDLRMMAAL